MRVTITIIRISDVVLCLTDEDPQLLSLEAAAMSFGFWVFDFLAMPTRAICSRPTFQYQFFFLSWVNMLLRYQDASYLSLPNL